VPCVVGRYFVVGLILTFQTGTSPASAPGNGDGGWRFPSFFLHAALRLLLFIIYRKNWNSISRSVWYALSLERVGFTRVLAAHPIYCRHLMTFSAATSSSWLMVRLSTYCFSSGCVCRASDAITKAATAKTFAFLLLSVEPHRQIIKLSYAHILWAIQYATKWEIIQAAVTVYTYTAYVATEISLNLIITAAVYTAFPAHASSFLMNSKVGIYTIICMWLFPKPARVRKNYPALDIPIANNILWPRINFSYNFQQSKLIWVTIHRDDGADFPLNAGACQEIRRYYYDDGEFL